MLGQLILIISEVQLEFDMNWLQRLEETKFWLMAIAVGLIALHLNLSQRANDLDLFGTSLLFWGAVASVIWERRHILTLESGVFSSFFGASLIALVLLKSSSISGFDIFLRFSPFISAISLAFLASGVRGLKQYWQELFILSFIIIPPGLLLRFVDLATLTAKFTAVILWYLGFPVNRQGVNLVLPTGTVEVASGCTGVHAILQLLGLAILCLFMFPTTLKQKILVPITAILIGFVVNAIRVGLMAILVAFSHPKSFEYWHTGTGSLIFSMIAVMIFGLFCWWAILRNEPKNQDAL